ncbi:MAG: hypothetical protein WBY53_03645 [Acidobacteriaceae bacterium]
MPRSFVARIALGGVVGMSLCGVGARAGVRGEKGVGEVYASMPPLERYLMTEAAEVALARTAAPASISGEAEVMVLRKDGYAPVVRGTNGFVCVVERGFGAATDAPVFWDPNVRSPICFNPAAARTFLPIYLMKTKLVLKGEAKAQIQWALSLGFMTKELPVLEPGAMCYMMSKEQYLGERDKSWHPHLMFFVAGDVGKSWGANVAGSPVMAANDPEERVTIFLVWVGKWSDGTAGPSVVR